MTRVACRLLVNYWYAHPVGHALEALRYALGYKDADPALRVSVLLNGATAVELAGCCPFVDAVYAVPYTNFVEADGDAAAALTDVPRVWDRVVENHRVHEASHDAFAGFRAFYDAAHAHLRPAHPTGVAGAEPPAYRPHRDLRLDLPAAARAAAAETTAGRRSLAVVLAGSSAARHLYPSAASWELILRALAARHPEHAICLIGKHAHDGRTTSWIDRADVDRLLHALPATMDCFDRPLLEQVALVEQSDLLVAPHTGFAFAASAVDTPWLALSGGNWHEYFFNGVPVYSLLPDTARYPAFSWGAPMPIVDDDGPRTPSMTLARFREQLPELLDAADALIERRLPYEQALAEYFPRLLRAYGGDRSRCFSFDDVGAPYLGAQPDDATRSAR
jgi:hypothetical protein